MQLMVDRLLSPNETKFWLLDVVAPMNVVVVVVLAGTIDPDGLKPLAFRLPSVVIGRGQRLRWTDSGVGSEFEALPEADPDAAWRGHAEQLLEARVGTEQHPPFCARLLCGEARSTLLLALNHALVDYRAGLWLAESFLRGIEPVPLAPACEELLPADAYGRADAEALIDAWWSRRAAERWEARPVSMR